MELFFLVAACLIAVGYYAYRKLQAMEHQIRAELDEDARERSDDEPGESQAEEIPTTGSDLVKVREESAVSPVEALVLQKVLENPGMLQTQLYAALPEKGKKELQAVLLRMDRKGRLRRVRKGNSYELHPL